MRGSSEYRVVAYKIFQLCWGVPLPCGFSDGMMLLLKIVNLSLTSGIRYFITNDLGIDGVRLCLLWFIRKLYCSGEDHLWTVDC